jgi:hypothetical protein
LAVRLRGMGDVGSFSVDTLLSALRDAIDNDVPLEQRLNISTATGMGEKESRN